MGLTEDVEILIDRGENYTFDNMVSYLFDHKNFIYISSYLSALNVMGIICLYFALSCVAFYKNCLTCRYVYSESSCDY